MSSKHKYTSKNSRHWQRRLIHLSMGLFPIIYYFYGEAITDLLHLQMTSLLLIIGVLLILLEALRIKNKWLFYGQRDYEINYPSAFFWSGIGIIMVLAFAPQYGLAGAAFGLPIIWSLCIGDPLLGESRRLQWPVWLGILATLTALTLIWLLATLWLGTPWYYCLFMPALAIAAEWPSLRWVDDNWMMQILPFFLVIILH